MISPQKAQNIIFQETPLLKTEKIPFLDARGRILSQDIKATGDLPPFDRSAMDGFAVRSQDIWNATHSKGVFLRLAGTVSCGMTPKQRLKRGEAVKVMTGAMVPRGADSIVIKENAVVKDKKVEVFKSVIVGEEIRFKGQDVTRGKTILRKGTRVSAGVISLLATLGVVRVEVYRVARIAVLVTGNELLGVNDRSQPGKVRNANQYALFSQIQESGGEPVLLGVARDDARDIKRTIKKGFCADMLLISGGVSEGDFDLVPGILRELGVNIFFHKVSIKPGKPLLFGKKDKTLVFGLPGNPVSTMVSFYRFIRPCLLKMCGAGNFNLPTAFAFLEEDIKLNPSRTKFLRAVTFERNADLGVRLCGHQGSGNILSMAQANCLLEVPEGIKSLQRGARLKIYYLP